ncbi:MAG: hypothetical protein EBT03_06160 [Betaproteobacteria bacterium]|nr:hypothetical protein [Betaproteobacteria bacterium]NDF03713.1 hypothetical protein [Betaproteobacteria bacterium]
MTEKSVLLDDSPCIGELQKKTLSQVNDDGIQRDFEIRWRRSDGAEMLGDFVIKKTSGEFGLGVVPAGVDAPRPLGFLISIGGFCREVQPAVRG